MTPDRTRLGDFTGGDISEKKTFSVYVNTNRQDVWGMGVVVVDEDGGDIDKTAKTMEESEYVDRTTHNVVEYEAVIYSLEYIKEEYEDENNAVFDIHTNSKTVIGEPQDNKMATLSTHVDRLRGEIDTNISYVSEDESTYMQTANELAREAAD